MDVDDILHNLLIDSLPRDKFSEAWGKEIGHLKDEVLLETRKEKLPEFGRATIHVFVGGLVAVESSKGKWSAFETLERVKEREYVTAWAEFIRGGWSPSIPQEAGVYPVKDLEGNRRRDRTLIRVNGRLADVTCCGGMVQYGKVSNWQGLWYTLPFPKLRCEL